MRRVPAKRTASVLLAATTAAAFAPPAASGALVLGVSVSGVKLGDTDAKVRRVLGAPAATTVAGGEATPRQARRIVTRTYRSGESVTFVSGRVTQVTTSDAAAVTRSGVGVGVSAADLSRRLSGETCARLGTGDVAVKQVLCVLPAGPRRPARTQFLLVGDPLVVQSVSLVAAPSAGRVAPAGRAGLITRDGVAGARIGMPEAAVAVKLGKPTGRRNVPAGPGEPAAVAEGLTEATYPGPVVVTFADGRVTSLVTRSPRHRTARGVRLGTTRQALRRLAPSAVCRDAAPSVVVCTDGGRPGATGGYTAYFLRGGTVAAIGVY